MLNFLKDFIYLIERQRKLGGGEQREREGISSRRHAEHGAPRGACSQDPGIMTWAGARSRMLNQLNTQVPLNVELFNSIYNNIHDTVSPLTHQQK